MIGLGFYMQRFEQWEIDGTEPSATWFPVVNLFIFMAASTIGYLVVPWVMIGELYPTKVGLLLSILSNDYHTHLFFTMYKNIPIKSSIHTQNALK